MNLTSIYTYLGKRFNVEAHKIGSLFFIISRAIGATARLYLVVSVLQIFLLEGLGRSVLVDCFGDTFNGIALHFRRWCKNHSDYRYASNFIYDYQLGRLYRLHFISFNTFTAPEAFDILASKNYTHFINTDINSKTFSENYIGRYVHHHCDDRFRPRNDAKKHLSRRQS